MRIDRETIGVPVFGEHVQDHMLVGLGNPGGELGLYPAARFADVSLIWSLGYWRNRL
jgi:hypothetical protein